MQGWLIRLPLHLVGRLTIGAQPEVVSNKSSPGTPQMRQVHDLWSSFLGAWL